MLAGRRQRALAAAVFCRRTLKSLLETIGFISLLATFGVNETAGVTALGIGGIALTLGAQKTIENLVGGGGSVSLLTNQFDPVISAVSARQRGSSKKLVFDQRESERSTEPW